MFTPPRFSAMSFLLVIVVTISAQAAQLALPRAVAAQATTMDATILAGPGWEYEPLTYAPVGSAISVDGEAVNGFVPVTFDGVNGWADVSVVGSEYVEQAQDTAVVPVEEAAPVEAAPVDEVPVEEVAPGEAAPVEEVPVAETAPVEEVPAPELAAEPIVSEEVVAEETPRSRRGESGDDLPPPRGDETSAGGDSAYTEDEIIGIIRDAAATHGQNPQAMLRVARCESGLNPSAVGGGIYFGLFQFVPSTFEGTPYGDGDIFDPWANANAAAWMWSEGRKGEWVCQ